MNCILCLTQNVKNLDKNASAPFRGQQIVSTKHADNNPADSKIPLFQFSDSFIYLHLLEQTSLISNMDHSFSSSNVSYMFCISKVFCSLMHKLHAFFSGYLKKIVAQQVQQSFYIRVPAGITACFNMTTIPSCIMYPLSEQSASRTPFSFVMTLLSPTYAFSSTIHPLRVTF